jgi:asparagine synthase (glutamine-hydrolysing)
MFQYLNGMWGLAIYDTRKQSVLLSRDRIGKKQIYYTQTPGAFYFASEIKALFAIPQVRQSRSVNDFWAVSYLCTGIKNDVNGSLFNGIDQLPAGHFAFVGLDSKLSLQKYWALPKSPRLRKNDVSMQEAVANLDTLLTDSTKIRMRADVPVAMELSSGLDSSAIALAISNIPTAERTMQAAYTVKYRDNRFDESETAALTAAQLGIMHKTLNIESSEYWDVAEELIGFEDQPYESPNLASSYFMWNQMSASGIRVAISGAGGDELFAGYVRRYLSHFLYELVLQGNISLFFAELSKWDQPYFQLIKSAVMHFAADSSDAAASFVVHKNRNQYLRGSSRLLANTKHNDSVDKLVKEMLRGTLSDQLRYSMEQFPMPMYLCHNDKMQMSIPIEFRYPFLDYRLVEFAFSLPIEYLMQGGFSKFVLRKLMSGKVPDVVTKEKQKRGFPVPLKEWIIKGRQYIAHQFAQNPHSMRFINPQFLIDNIDILPQDLLWRCHQLELWMTKFDLA